jgi:subtilisin-like proprotein convertase family protein
MIRVDHDFRVADLSVRLNITTSRAGTLYIHLQGPDGTDVILARYVGGDRQNFSTTLFDDEAGVAISAGHAPFNGAYRPMVPLSNFDGKRAHGYWKLWVEDSGGPSTSVLTSWSLIFTPKPGGR